MTANPEINASLGTIAVERENLLPSLVEAVAGLTEGQSNFVFDEKTYTLQPILQPRQLGEWPLKAVSLLKQQYSQIGHFLITMAHPELVHNMRADIPLLSMDVCDGRLVTAEFTAPLAGDSQMNANFKSNGSSIESRVRVYLSLIKQLDSFNLIYRGDQTLARFSNLENYTPEQLRLVFDGQVPDLNLQQIMFDTFLLNKRNSGKPALPQLTFNPDRYVFNPDHSRVYLVQPEDSLPPVESGAIITGVAIIKTNQPFRLAVQADKVEEISYEYSNESGKATRISGVTNINDGKKMRRYPGKFIILSDLKYLRMHPELVPGGAFEQFHR